METPFKPRRGRYLSTAILLLLTEAVYLRPAFLTGAGSLLGTDYARLHIRRIAFAQQAVFGPAHSLPAWYPRELLGSPFLANIQNFPWIPTRLILLFFDPLAAFAAGVAIAAALSSLFTYLFCRRAGICEIGAIAAGWTFACAGYFASRIVAGHLPLLEAYPALPLLLWLAARALAPDRATHAARDLAVLAVACAAVAVAGHPQLPAYSLGAALLYILVTGRGRRRFQATSAMVLGVATTLVIWWPAFLEIRSSTRILRLAAPDNDIAMPYRRLASLILPGIDGWPNVMGFTHQKLFQGYPNDAYFWDTCSYMGLLPLAALLGLFALCLIRKQLPTMPWMFLALVGAGALLFSLPLAEPMGGMVPGTLFRSPARLLYLSTFAAAVALGYAVTKLLNSALLPRRVTQGLIGAALLFHALDLGGFSRHFVLTVHWPAFGTAAFDGILNREFGNGRIAADDMLSGHDDAGFFDSIILANPYRAILGIAGHPPDYNTQFCDASTLPIPALQHAGVRFVITQDERADLELVKTSDGDSLYRVPNPVPRVAFFPQNAARYAPREKLLEAFLARPDRDTLLLPAESQTASSTAASGGAGNTKLTYTRPSSDEIRLSVAAREAGFVHVLESYDPGWTAELDGRGAPVTLANGFSMAVPVEPGTHAIRLRYHTPGRATGWALSWLSALLLVTVIRTARAER